MIHLSADLGEGTPGEDELWPLLDAANVACGGHVGDDASMRHAAAMAAQYGLTLGAHPSYPDRENFGRRSLQIASEALHDSLVEQIAALHAIANVHHVKPHGALYNDAHRDRALAEVVVSAIRAVGSPMSIVAPRHSQLAAAARAANVPLIAEAFADRRYAADGSLVPRSEPRSLLSVEEAVQQVLLLTREGVVMALDGSRVRIAFDTICIHADMDGALERARAIRAVIR